MPPVAQTYVYTDADSVAALLSEDGVTGRIDDDADGFRNSAEEAYLTRAIQWATSRVNLYCNAYRQQDLAESMLVNWWCTIIAAHTVSTRRGNPSAGSLAESYDEVMEDLKAIRSGEYHLPDVATRDSAFPAWSNISVSMIHRLKRLRVERPISSAAGDRSGQVIDRRADVIGPFEIL